MSLGHGRIWRRSGSLAATSTGGITNKQAGRVGDAPLIGAGCYANDATCAVSTTGTGEMFIRMLAAYDVSAQMEYRGVPLKLRPKHWPFDPMLAANPT